MGGIVEILLARFAVSRHGIKCRVTFARPEQPPRARFAFRGTPQRLVAPIGRRGTSPPPPRRRPPFRNRSAHMGMESVRIAFAAAAGGALRLEHAGLSYQGGNQVLSLTGWHADGTPFALVTAPFAGDVQARARPAGRDIIWGAGAAPNPIDSLRRKPPMSKKGSGLARLRGGLMNLDASADALATRLESAMGSLQGEM